MKDPHVVSLTYKIKTNASVNFNNPPAIEDETGEFKLKLINGKATFELKKHFSTVESARIITDNYIRSWEIDNALSLGRHTMELDYESAKVKDRNPPYPGEPITMHISGAIFGSSSVNGSLSVTRETYPSPPKHFKVNPDVETLWYRFKGYTQGKEPLAAMAYFCLSLLEFNALKQIKSKKKKLEKVALLYQIHIAVIKKLGELTSTRGDKKTARKIDNKSSTVLHPLTPKEANWIETTIKVIIRRVGEMDSGKPLEEITMNDLPTL